MKKKRTPEEVFDSLAGNDLNRLIETSHHVYISQEQIQEIIEEAQRGIIPADSSTTVSVVARDPYAEELLTSAIGWLERLVNRREMIEGCGFFDNDTDPAPAARKIRKYLTDKSALPLPAESALDLSGLKSINGAYLYGVLRPSRSWATADRGFWDREAELLRKALAEKLRIKPAPTEPSAEDYLAGHKASGLKVGDRVRVIRAAKDYEEGWDNTWTEYMDPIVGTEQSISMDAEAMGFNLKGIGESFPHFVLEKVEPAPPEYNLDDYRPWTPDEAIGQTVSKVGFEHCRQLIVNTVEDSGKLGGEWIPFAELLANFRKKDGTPCGELKSERREG